MSDIQKSGTIRLHQRTATRVHTSSLLLGALAISSALALFAIFTLASWAELSPLHHGVQHVLLFLGGVGFGGSLLGLRKNGEKH